MEFLHWHWPEIGRKRANECPKNWIAWTAFCGITSNASSCLPMSIATFFQLTISAVSACWVSVQARALHARPLDIKSPLRKMGLWIGGASSTLIRAPCTASKAKHKWAPFESLSLRKCLFEIWIQCLNACFVHVCSHLWSSLINNGTS